MTNWIKEIPDLGDNRQEFERKSWAYLESLANNNDIKGFYAAYAVYLEKNNIISTSRTILHKMAKLASQ